MAKTPGKRIEPEPIEKGLTVSELIEGWFTAYNAARVREICALFERKMLKPEVTIGMSISGALTPAGFGSSIFAPLIKNGYIDWIVSTGANVYHDLHYALDFKLHSASPFYDDSKLREKDIIRIYDILFKFDVLERTDAYLYYFLHELPAGKKMGTAELHYLLGKHVLDTQKSMGVERECLLTAAYKAKVPIYTSSPGDSTIGMNIAAVNFLDAGPQIDPTIDVNETTAIVFDAKRNAKKKHGVWIVGGGSPKNFMLQTEPQIQEIYRIPEKGHDYFVQITDARPDTGGLSGATPHEAVSWGKVDPKGIPDTVVCYADSTIVMPLVAAWIMDRIPRRKLSKLYSRRDEMVERLRLEYEKCRTRRPRQKKTGGKK